MNENVPSAAGARVRSTWALRYGNGLAVRLTRLPTGAPETRPLRVMKPAPVSFVRDACNVIAGAPGTVVAALATSAPAARNPASNSAATPATRIPNTRTCGLYLFRSRDGGALLASPARWAS